MNDQPKPLRIGIIGASGHAREVEWLLRDINQSAEEVEPYQFQGYLVSDLKLLGATDSKEKVLGDLRWLNDHAGELDALAMGIGTPAPKSRITAELKPLFPSLYWPALIHPTAQLDIVSCSIAEGVTICAGVIGSVNIRIGAFALLNRGCILGHEAQIGEHCVINPGAVISGGVELGSRTLVGTGAKILQYIKVGSDSVIAAGAVVTRDVGERETVVGIPAKARKTPPA